MENFILEGKEFKSIKEVCIHYKVSYSKIVSRVRKGMSLEEAVKLDGRADHGSRSVEVGGVVYKSMKDACIKNGVNYHTVWGKVRIGLSLEDAINEAKGIESREVIVEGVRYNTILEACKQYDMVYQTVIARMGNGMSLEEALLNKKDGRCREVEAFGVKYKSLSEACRVNKVDGGYVRYQMSKGKSIEEAIKVVKDKYGDMIVV